jgi:predicted transcriptional regulator
MSDLTNKLTDIKDRIDKTTAKRNRLEGERGGLMKRLADDHGCDTVKEAEERLAELTEEIAEETPLLEKAVAELAEEVGI